MSLMIRFGERRDGWKRRYLGFQIRVVEDVVSGRSFELERVGN